MGVVVFDRPKVGVVDQKWAWPVKIVTINVPYLISAPSWVSESVQYRTPTTESCIKPIVSSRSAYNHYSIIE